MSNKSKSNSFIIQGSILAFAGILVRVIGLIYRIPLNRILGESGMGYYGTAFEIYNVLILLSSQSMPLAVSKIVSEKLEKKQYKNAHKVFKGALIYGITIGVIFGMLAFFGADWISVKIYKLPQVAIPLRILAPTLTVACVLGVLRGYFQGMGNMIPTSVSQIFEQIVNAVVSVIAAYELGAYGYSLSKMADESETFRASYSAAGGTLGTLCGAVTALIIMIIILYRHFGSINSNIRKDITKSVDSYGTITKVIVFTITPVLISTTIYNIGNLLDNPIFQNIMYSISPESTEAQRSAVYGNYTGIYRTLTTMPIAIASALSTAIVPSLVRSYVAEDKSVVKNKIDMALKFSMIIAFPCGMGLSVLGVPINKLLFGSSGDGAAPMMVFSIFTVIAFSLSTISNAILQGIDKLKVPIKNSAISLGLHLIILPCLLIVFKLNIYGVVIGDILFGATVSVLNAMSIKKYLNYRQNMFETFVKPFICAGVMGAGCFGIYKLFNGLIKINAISTIIAIMVAVVIYALMLVITKTVTEDELLSMPKGAMIAKLMKKIHMI
ncbi:polysaccharide biosynthesis protein [Eubacterium sp. AF15-50]|uniref:putative polysaccharide biosynthesis protein n=1 Tax=unclassified Eubacterium (in: firmicutes) TaxID=2624479 RepID=UPI000E49CACE|nr:MULTISPECIES: polysaccharide biosynthesis protein [unclassified Eubacterium (in: firmicutes)]RHR74422.1 polysaccharide biosynthesis protein [Eubacterium sp. AF16-48]RHR81956.1 polysaccharide biosynthesis protein [Eubacterium sp. AF15-50]